MLTVTLTLMSAGSGLFRLREPSYQFARNNRAWNCVNEVGGSEASRHDLSALHTRYQAALELRNLTMLALHLGLSAGSLQRLGLGWCGWGWTFPMMDASVMFGGIPVR